MWWSLVLGLPFLVAGTALGCVVGARRERQRALRKIRESAARELGEKVGEMRRDFLAWSAPRNERAWGGPSRFEQSWRIGRELAALRAGYEARAPRLGPEACAAFEELDDALEECYLALAAVLWANAAPEDGRSVHDEEAAAGRVYEWARKEDVHDGLLALARRFEDEAERVGDDRSQTPFARLSPASRIRDGWRAVARRRASSREQQEEGPRT